MADETPAEVGPTPDPEPAPDVPESQEPAEEPTSEVAAEDSESPELADLKAKYPGKSNDEILREVAKSYFHQARSNSDLRGELDEIKALIAAQKQQPEDEPEPEPEPEEVDLGAFDADIQALEAQLQSNEKRQAAALRELGDAQRRIGICEGRLDAALDDEKPHWRRELSTAQAEQRRSVERFEELSDKAPEIKRALAAVQRSKTAAEKQLQAQKARQKSLAREQAENQSRREQWINQNYDGAIQAHAKELKIPKELREHFENQVYAQTMAWLGRHRGEKSVDIGRLTGHFSKVVAESYDLAGRASFRTASQAKLETTRKVAPTPQTKPASSRPQPQAKGQAQEPEPREAIEERIQQYHLNHQKRVEARLRAQTRRPA